MKLAFSAITGSDEQVGRLFGRFGGIGCDGWVSADEESGADVVEAMRTCLRFLRAGLGMGQGRFVE